MGDESKLFWSGPDWHEHGISARFVEDMATRHIHVFIVHSWTKIFACPGLRIGSVSCPTIEKRQMLQSRQVPWSVNAFAQAYLQAAVQDRAYLERTWRATARWRKHALSRLQRLHPAWKFGGRPWLPW